VNRDIPFIIIWLLLVISWKIPFNYEYLTAKFLLYALVFVGAFLQRELEKWAVELELARLHDLFV